MTEATFCDELKNLLFLKRTCGPKLDTQKHDYNVCEFHMTFNEKIMDI